VHAHISKSQAKNYLSSDPGYLFIYLKFGSPCIIIHSNKSTNQMHQSLRFIARRLTLKSLN